MANEVVEYQVVGDIDNCATSKDKGRKPFKLRCVGWAIILGLLALAVTLAYYGRCYREDSNTFPIAEEGKMRVPVRNPEGSESEDFEAIYDPAMDYLMVILKPEPNEYQQLVRKDSPNPEPEKVRMPVINAKGELAKDFEAVFDLAAKSFAVNRKPSSVYDQLVRNNKDSAENKENVGDEDLTKKGSFCLPPGWQYLYDPEKDETHFRRMDSSPSNEESEDAGREITCKGCRPIKR